MTTNIPERTLVELRTSGFQRGVSDTFVNPTVIALCTKILQRRGEQWAAAVLGRDINRRSLAVAGMPFLRVGEEYTLVYADAEEDKIVVGEMGT